MRTFIFESSDEFLPSKMRRCLCRCRETIETLSVAMRRSNDAVILGYLSKTIARYRTHAENLHALIRARASAAGGARLVGPVRRSA